MTTQPNITLPVTVTVLLFAGGAWLASYLTSTPAVAETIGQATSEQPQSAQLDSPATAQTGLKVNIGPARNTEGKVLIMVFDNPEAYAAYDYNRAAAYAEIAAAQSEMSAVFPELTLGPYVVSIMHDENNDAILSMEGEHPLEGYGTSKADDPYSELSFSEASIMPGEVEIKLHYLR